MQGLWTMFYTLWTLVLLWFVRGWDMFGYRFF